jgi:hypothetical protein
MKKSFAILIAIVVLASGMQVSIDRHYCCGTLADIKISLTGKKASCGMEQALPGCPDDPVINKRCCENQISFYSLSSNYYPEYFRLTHPVTQKDIIPVHLWNNISNNSYDSGLTNWVLPPGPDNLNCLTRPQICIFQV